jgi:hypothetical protein
MSSPPLAHFPIFLGFLLPYPLFAILRVVFIYFLLNDHDPSGAVTPAHKETLSKLKYDKVAGVKP